MARLLPGWRGESLAEAGVMTRGQAWSRLLPPLFLRSGLRPNPRPLDDHALKHHESLETFMRIGVLRISACVFTATLACSTLTTRQAQAQFGYGFGYGFGGAGFNNGAQTIESINSLALMNASKATMGPVQNNVYANNPNAYINKLHDPGYLDKYDVGTRRTIEATIGRFSDGPPPSRSRPAPPRSVAATPPPQPTIPLSGFFDRYRKLIWPESAPNYGTLATARVTSDQACLAVFNEYDLKGLASVSTVTDARSKLLDYGRPALQYIRANTTPRIADSFHLFLLSLYESLAQAATIPKPTPAASPNQPLP
jgi:hypothetical protein